MATFKHFDLAKGWPVTTGPWKVTAASLEQKVFDRRPTWWAAEAQAGADAADPAHLFKEDAEEENHEDGRRQVALHRLQVVVKSRRTLDHRDPGQRNQHHGSGGDAADAHDLVLRGGRFPLLVKDQPVNKVEQALNTPASDPIRAESRPATTMPRNPGGSRYSTIMGNVNALWNISTR